MEDILAWQVTGMRCAACAANLEKKAAAFPGVVRANASFAGRRLVVTPGPTLAVDALTTTLEGLGFGLFPPREVPTPEPSEGRRLAFTIPAAVLVAGLERGLFGVDPGIAVFPALLVQAVAGYPFYRGAGRALRAGSANMDVLVALGSTTAFLAALLGHSGGALGCGGFRFETAAMLLAFVGIGRALEARIRGRAQSVLERLAGHETPSAILLGEGGKERELPPEALRPGDRILVRAGGLVPADALVEEGESDVGEAFLTGEPLPIAKRVGDRLWAGSVNGPGRLVARVERVGSGTVLGRILALAEASLADKPPIQRQADRIAEVFVPGVVLLACASALVWALLGRPDVAWQAGTAVLVVACPCALGLATPTALMVASGKALERGLLFTSGTALEALARAASVGLDKTGTLTQGSPAVVRTVLPEPPAEGLDASGVLRWAARLEDVSAHPLALAIRKAAPADAQPPDLDELREEPGAGVTATVEGRRWCLGSRALLLAEGVEAGALDALDATAGPGPGTRLYLARDRRVLGLIELADPLRPEAPTVTSALVRLGLRPVLLSGDRPEAAAALGRQLGLEAQGGLSPAQKLAWVEAEEAAGRPVAYVGDGINDAAALARASAGIAMRRGAEPARVASAVLLLEEGLGAVPRAIVLARRTVAVIRQNLAWAFAYNLVGLPLAAGVAFPFTGWLIPPHWAGLAMGLSSVAVVANSLRLLGDSVEP